MKNLLLAVLCFVMFFPPLFAQDAEETFTKTDVLYSVHLPLLASKRIDVNGKKFSVDTFVYIKNTQNFTC